MTTKNRRAVGTLGLAAVVAVLAVSMIAMNFTSQPAIGEQQGANKVGTAVSMMTFLHSTTQNDLPDIIIQYEGKASDKHDVLSRVTLECTTQTEVKASGAKGKKESTDTASAGAVVWFTYSGEDGVYHLIDINGNIDHSTPWVKGNAVPFENLWHVCGQEMELKVNLNPIIVVCPDPEAGFCHEGQLVFACDVPGNTIPEDECDQWVQIFLATWGTHTAVTLVNNVPHGDYYISVWGDTSFDPSDHLDPALDRTTVIIGKKFLENTPILMDNPST